MHFYRWLFVYLFVCFRTVAGTFGKVALSQMFVLHSTEAWKEKIKVDEQDNCAQEKKNWFWKKQFFLHRIKVVLIQGGIFSISTFPRNPSSHTEEG